MQQLKVLARKFRHAFPSALPRSKEQFDAFCTEIFETYGFQDGPGYRHALATQIMHFKDIKTTKPKRFFGQVLRNAQCREAAWAAIEQAREEIKAANGPKEVSAPPA